MSFFSRKSAPPRPPETFTPPKIRFVGEQSGPVEDKLKMKFCEVLTQSQTVQSAYLARLSYGESPEYSVGLCIRSTVGIDQTLQKRLGQVFTETFRSDEHLDILFIRDEQDQELRKVCKAFYERPNSILNLGATKI